MARVPINNGDDGLDVRNALNAMFTEIYAFAIANIAGLQPALDLKAPLASPPLTGVPTAPTAANATNNTQIATTAFVQSVIASVINSAPGALDTLDELAAALGDDANFAATMTTALAGKQPIDATLTALAALAGGADKLAYFTGVDVLAEADLTAFGRSVIALANAAALRALINVADGATANSSDATLLARANHTGTQPASTISDFTEASQDVIGAMVTAAGGSYDDGAGTITLPGGGYTDEQVRDVIGTALVEGAGIDITVNDAGDTITVASTITQYTDENARDAIGAAIVEGAGIDVTVNDAGDTITIASTITQYTDEQVRDVIGTALVEGSGIDITVNDAGDTITIAATGGGGGGSGDVVGPAGSTDLAIARYDGATGKLLQNSPVIVDDEGAIRSATNAGANPVSVPLVNYLYQNADYALTNSTAEQKIFNETTNGRLDLPTGFYRFKAFFYVTGMSATSGNASFDPVGAGTAVCSDFAYDSYGLDNNTQPNAVLAISGVGSVTQQSGANIVLAGTGTGMRVSVQGVFRIDTAGTIVPSLAMVTASAATVKAGSHFIIEKIGEASENTVGDWD